MSQSIAYDINAKSSQKRKISGLFLTRERILTYNHTKDTNIDKKTFVITDLKNMTGGKQNGTKVEIFIIIDHEKK